MLLRALLFFMIFSTGVTLLQGQIHLKKESLQPYIDSIAQNNFLHSRTYRTTGNSQDWSDPLAWTCDGYGCENTPPSELEDGERIYIEHDIQYSGSDIEIDQGHIYIQDSATLEMLSGDLKIDDKFQAKVIIDHGSLLINSGYLRNKGYLSMKNAFIKTEGNLDNDELIYMDYACIEVENGSFLNNYAVIFGPAGNVKVNNGNIENNNAIWDSDVSYCVSGNIVGSLPGAEDCPMVTDECACLEVLCDTTNTDILPGHTEGQGELVSPALIALAGDGVNEELEADLFIPNSVGSVLIDISFKDRVGTYNQVLSKYGIGVGDPNIIYDGGISQIPSNVITLFFPVADILDLDTTMAHGQYINSVTQTFPSQGGPISNVEEQGSSSSSGGGNVSVTGSSLPNQGDFAQESFFMREGYDINGSGVNIGVLSDSYDNGGQGSPVVDIQDGYLPSNVQIVKDLAPEIGSGIDEGRAMMQIIHSVAPGSNLFFHTGFEGPGNMAEAIDKLANENNCQVMVDDITLPGQPFFGSGVVGAAIEQVTSSGEIMYLTSAGNFADRAWSSTYQDLGGRHDFGGGNTLQPVNLGVGAYLIVMQWEDEFFSLTTDGPGGAQNDFDIFLANNSGNSIYNFSRNNLGDDPVEILPFYVQNSTTTNIVIQRVAGTASPRIKYIVYKAGEKNEGFSLVDPSDYGQGTITGHASSPAAITVGAVRFDNTPAYGGVLETQGFSSRGDLVTPNKPDLTAVNGGNISFDLGGGDYAGDSDNLPNFFGTSSSAPHAAAAAALLLDAKTKFLLNYDVRGVMQSKAISYGEMPNAMGAGFLSAYQSLLDFANPSPSITQLDISGFGGTPDQGGELVIRGEYFLSGTTEVYFRDQLLTPITITDSSITVYIPPFSGGNPPIWVINEAAATGDGGVDTAYFSDPVFTMVNIIANDTSKRFGEELPGFTFRTEPSLSAQEMALLTPFVSFSTNATALTDAESFPAITPYLTVAEENLPPELNEVYQFNAVPGNIYIAPMELKIIPEDFTVQYGSAIRDEIEYRLEFGTPENPANILPSNLTDLENGILQDYHSSQANDLLILTDISLSNIALSNISLSNFISLSNTTWTNISLSNILDGKSFVTSFKTLKNISLSNISLSNISLSNTLNSAAVPIDVSLFDLNSQWDGGTEFGNTYTNISLSNISLSNFISLSNAQAANSNASLNSLVNISLSNISLSNFISLSNISLSNISLSNISLSNFISLSNISSITNISLSNGDIVQDYDDAAFRNFISLSNNDNTEILSIFEESEAEADYDSIIPLFPINFISGVGSGDQILAPAAFMSDLYSKNFIVTYGLGTAEITQAGINIETHDTSAIFGEEIPNFRISIDGLKYLDSLKNVLERIDLINQATQLPYDGSPGDYNIVPVINNDNYIVSSLLVGTFTVAEPQADISVTKTDGVVTAVPGMTELQYSITVTNTGPNPDPTVSLLDMLPDDLTATFTSMAMGGATGNTPNGSDDLDETLSMPVNSSVTYLVNATIDASARGVVSNLVTVTGSLLDPNPVNNEMTDETQLIPEVDIGLYQRMSTDSVTAGSEPGNLMYLISVINHGPSDATNVKITESILLPMGVTVDEITPMTGGYSPQNSPMGMWTIDYLPAGDSAILKIGLSVSTSSIPGALITNTAQLSSVTEVETNLSNNSAAEMSIIKACTPPAPPPVITGPVHLCTGQRDIPYSIHPVAAGMNYQWHLNEQPIGMGAHVEIDIFFTAATISVTAENACGTSAASTLDLSRADVNLCRAFDCLQTQPNLVVDDELLQSLLSPDVLGSTVRLESDATIQAMEAIIFRAGTEIVLNPPFTVENGATFYAQIKSCLTSTKND
ncbi:MAG: S8 family serine peptidase [Saprospiraceae bacterium]|nr:S8 family serine peptidase [Saprospiraceae bacterium]